MTAIPSEEIDRRLEALQTRLDRSDPPVDAAIIIQSVDQYYLSGTIQNSHLVVPARGAPRLLVRKVLERAQEESPLKDIRGMQSLKNLPEEVARLCGRPPWRLAMELDVLPVSLLKMYQSLFGQKTEFVDVSKDLLEIRSVKSAWEVAQVRESAQINDRIYRDLPDLLTAGLSTYELQAILDCRARTAGHVGLVRMRGFNVDGLIGVVVSGPTGAAAGHSQFPIGGTGPHPCIAHGGDFHKIEANTPIIFDYLANKSGYHHDQTRMAVIGRMPEEAERIFRGMQKVLRSIEESLRPGAIPSQLYLQALEEARALGLADGFMGLPGRAVPFVGHAVGLEVNESPVLARRFDPPLVAGNVLAIEPKFTHPDFGVIGLENTYLVRDGGYENLSDTPEDVVVAGSLGARSRRHLRPRDVD
jgi:Xaa-Pro dipeptidase